MGNVTHGSGSPTKTDHWGSGCSFCRGGYPPWVPAIYPPKFPIKIQIYKLNFTISFEYRILSNQRDVEDACGIETSCLNIPTRYLQPPRTPKHQCPTHTSPSPRRGMWANINLPQTSWTQPFEPTSNALRVTRASLRHGFDNSNMDSTTPMQVRQTIRVQQCHMLEFHNDESWMTRIWPQQYGFDNDDTSSTTTEIRWQWCGSRDVGRFVFTQQRKMWDRLEGGKLRFRWYVANSFHPFLSTDANTSNPTRTPRTQRGHLKPNANTLNPTRTPRTQHGHLEPNTDASNLTRTCRVEVHRTPNKLRQPWTCRVEHGRVEDLTMARFMDHGACRGV